MEGCETQFRAAFLLGCVGAWSLHPAQIAIAKKVFSPDPDEVAFAKKVIEAIPDGRGVHMIDGKMQDDATWKQCKVMVNLAEMLAAKDPELAEAYGIRPPACRRKAVRSIPPMRFFEYEAREIVKRAGIPVTEYGLRDRRRGGAARSPRRIGGPDGDQVAGADRRAHEGRRREVRRHARGGGRARARRSCELEISGHMPRGVLVDPKARGRAGVLRGRRLGRHRASSPMIDLLATWAASTSRRSPRQHPDHVGRGHFSNLLPLMRLPGQGGDRLDRASPARTLNRLTPILSRLAALFVEYDMTLAEINPLGELEDGTFVALDAHMDMENEARPRQQALLAELGVGDEETREAREPTPFEIAGEAVDAVDHRGVAGNVTEFDGNLGLVIGAGGGSLTLFDAVRKHGGKPANYCEIGGNPSVAKACGLAKLVLSKPGVDKIAVMMSIVSNTRVDIVARGVIKACVELGYDPAEKIAIFRIPGAWEEEGFKILEKYGVEYCRPLACRCTRPRGAPSRRSGAAA